MLTSQWMCRNSKMKKQAKLDMPPKKFLEENSLIPQSHDKHGLINLSPFPPNSKPSSCEQSFRREPVESHRKVLQGGRGAQRLCQAHSQRDEAALSV